MLLLHAIEIGGQGGRSARWSAGRRVRDWPLCAVHGGELVAIASHMPGQVQLGREELLAHHAIAEQALGNVLPARFPTWIADEVALRDLLEQKQAALLAALTHVRGRVELAVTITSDPAPLVMIEALTPGRQYLERRRGELAQLEQRREAAQHFAQRIEQCVGPDLVEARHSLAPGEAVVLSSALLVGIDRAIDIKARLDGLESENVRILVNGPWPPYTFSELGPREV